MCSSVLVLGGVGVPYDHSYNRISELARNDGQASPHFNRNRRCRAPVVGVP